MVRALPGILGQGARVVELPLNATEDRVVGTLHVGTLIKSGEREFVPGVLAEADGNVLYVDEINLLEDHIVDLLLDAAATGTCRIEREGMSREYAARFVLIGTMNPEEGTLRPQLLDRFGLSVRVTGSLTSDERLELVRRQVLFEEDSEGFNERFAASARVRRFPRACPRPLFPGAFPLCHGDVSLDASGVRRARPCRSPRPFGWFMRKATKAETAILLDQGFRHCQFYANAGVPSQRIASETRLRRGLDCNRDANESPSIEFVSATLLRLTLQCSTYDCNRARMSRRTVLRLIGI